MRDLLYLIGKRRRQQLLALLAIAAATFGISGCNKPAPPSSAPATGPSLPTVAQPKLSTVKLWLGPEEINAELALTFAQQETGMMFRTNMDENGGMLFPLASTQRAAFWMKNCPLPLSIAYINSAGVIEEIRDMQPNDTNNIISASANIRFALETQQGWFTRHAIKPGTVVRTEHGSLMETFFRK